VKCGFWTRWQISSPTAVLTNARKTLSEVQRSRLGRNLHLYCVPNTIDVPGDDQLGSVEKKQNVTAVLVGRLIPVKRVDCFLSALAEARRLCPNLEGIVIGDGPTRGRAEKLAAELMLEASALRFLGQRDDVWRPLRQSEMLVLCSDDEGFPNVLLEAMAAGLPVVSTPAGDAEVVVEDGVTGYVVPFENVKEMAERMVRLAVNADLRRQMGATARLRVRQLYSHERLAGRLLAVYRDLALQQNNQKLVSLLSAHYQSEPSC
jgi:glycosyltransferase involved in cell wall biosynthesis